MKNQRQRPAEENRPPNRNPEARTAMTQRSQRFSLKTPVGLKKPCQPEARGTIPRCADQVQRVRIPDA
ncbi:MAG: hypothetical protein MZV64_37040 [Ignavibacteriales bacterium]|nr:hypothetical protein [Ignavibacteriales bacterium]